MQSHGIPPANATMCLCRFPTAQQASPTQWLSRAPLPRSRCPGSPLTSTPRMTSPLTAAALWASSTPWLCPAQLLCCGFLLSFLCQKERLGAGDSHYTMWASSAPWYCIECLLVFVFSLLVFLRQQGRIGVGDTHCTVGLINSLVLPCTLAVFWFLSACFNVSARKNKCRWQQLHCGPLNSLVLPCTVAFVVDSASFSVSKREEGAIAAARPGAGLCSDFTL